MLHILHPPTYLPEREYIYDTLLRDFLGLDYQASIADRRDIQITLPEEGANRRLILADTLFATPEPDWLTERSMPPEPLRHLTPPPGLTPGHWFSGSTPVIFGAAGGQAGDVATGEDEIRLTLDLFGSAFFLLSRYEEIARPVQDRHDRFPATASLAYRAGFLDRPVVNEYVDLLWACLASLWPALERKQRSPRIFLSHDVDWPVVTRGRSLNQTVKAAAGDLARRRDPLLSASRLRSWAQVRAGAWDHDVGNTFDFMMRTAEQHGLRSAFYFIAGHTAGDLDGVYSLDDPWIQALMRRIADRGHEIGLHPSYNTYLDASSTTAEFANLLRTCDKLGISQPAWGGRQHYLRWRNPDTWQNWADAGLAYDSSLGFADEIGFRCGVCYEFRPYHLIARRPINLIERPLVVMDATLMGDADRPGGSVNPTATVSHITRLHNVCARHNGDFTLLWHNTWLLQRSQKNAFQESIAALTA